MIHIARTTNRDLLKPLSQNLLIGRYEKTKPQYRFNNAQLQRPQHTTLATILY